MTETVMVIFDYHAFQLIFIRPSFIYANITTWLNEKIEKKISLSEQHSSGSCTVATMADRVG